MDDDISIRSRELHRKYLGSVVSVGALSLAVVHLIWPKVAIDGITLTLIGVALLPWLAPLVKSLELPGGWKVELRDLQRVALRADALGLLAEEASPSEASYSFQFIASRDPILALAGLRIEIEKRLSELARVHDFESAKPMGIGRLLRYLVQRKALNDEERSILSDMVSVLNSAIHGREIASGVAEWAIDVGPRLLTSLDERISEGRHPALHGLAPD